MSPDEAATPIRPLAIAKPPILPAFALIVPVIVPFVATKLPSCSTRKGAVARFPLLAPAQNLTLVSAVPSPVIPALYSRRYLQAEPFRLLLCHRLSWFGCYRNKRLPPNR